MLNTLLILFAILALLGVIFEEKTHVNKAKVTLFFGTLSWFLLFIQSAGSPESQLVDQGFSENIGEIASLWLFLLAAMTFVAYLNKKGVIQNVIYLLLPEKITEKALLFLTGIFCFVFSSLCDNITATLVSIALVLSLKLPLDKTLKFATLVVFAVNSGGVALITGDVTTLMMFLADKVSIPQLLLLSLPALAAVLLLAFMLSFGLSGQIMILREATEIRTIDKWIAGIFITTILATIVGNVLFAIPPVLSFLTGLSVMFLVARFFNEDIDNDPILEYIRIIEFETLMFFLGVLLIVGMLQEIQVLAGLANIYQLMPAISANYLMGITSAFIDNVPLTAALLKAGIEMDVSSWLSLTYAVGVGGSLMIIGSAAGIVAMSKVKGLTFGAYLKYSGHLLLAYSAGFAGAVAVGKLFS